MDMLYDEIFYDSNEPTDSTQGRSIVSLIFLNNSLGVSWYNELNNSIQTTAIASNMEDFESIIQSLKQECFPTLFLLHPKLASNSSLIDIITVPTPLSNNQNYEFNVPKSSSWQIETSFNLILTYLNVREFNLSSNLGVDAKVYQNLHHLSARVDINNPLVKQSLGALIVYIKAKILVLDNESGNVVIASITVLNWRKYMKIDDNSLRSLQIFTRDVHPNALKENQHSKEGFSLFSLMDRTISLPGRQRLKELMMRPLIDKSLIEERQNLIECILKLLKEGNVIKEISKDLSHIHDIRKTLLRIKKAEASYLDWNKLYYSIESGVSIMTTIQEYCNQKDNISSLIKKFIDSVDLPQISELNHLLSDILDCKKSTVEKEVYIRDGYDNELDDIRSCLESLPSILFTTAHEILDTIPLVKNITIQYMTHVGYLIAVDETEVHLLADETSLFEFIYKQDSTYFYKHPIVVQLDDKYGDVVSSMKDRQKQVLLCLEDVVLDHEVVLQTLICNIAELDAFISLATISKELKFSKPTISEIENIIIRNGRHPLQELTVDTFVPNDTYLSQEKFIGIITGPNNSGKSVYVKQVGVIVYLAQIGSFVPCELAIIGLCDSIMTRVSSVETISSMQSSFTIDLTQVGFMIRNATKRSLLLLDEFGKGTSPIDGISLLGASIDYFVKRGCRTLCALHFTEILEDGLLSDRTTDKLVMFHMGCMQEEKCDDNLINDEKTIPLYKLRLGLSSSSEGIPCAKASGLLDIVVRRAMQVKESIRDKKAIEPTMKIRNNNDQENNNLIEVLTLFFQCKNWNNTSESEIEKLIHLIGVKH